MKLLPLALGATLLLLAPTHAATPTPPNVLGVYEGHLRVARPAPLPPGLSRPFDVHLEITAERDDGFFNGIISTTFGLERIPVQGTISARRKLLLSAFTGPTTVVFQAGGKFDSHLRRLSGSFEATSAHGIINLRRIQ